MQRRRHNSLQRFGQTLTQEADRWRELARQWRRVLNAMKNACARAQRIFAGLLSDAPAPLTVEQGAAVMQGPAGDSDDGEAPLHDQAVHRLALNNSAISFN